MRYRWATTSPLEASTDALDDPFELLLVDGLGQSNTDQLDLRKTTQ